MSSMNDPNPGESTNLARIQETIPIQSPTRVITPQLITADIPIAAGDQSEFDMSQILHALRRNWLLGSLLGIILAGPLAFGAWSLFPLKYTAVEYVRISPTQTSLVFDSGETTNRNDFRLFKNTQKQLVIQSYALNKALKDGELASYKAVTENPNIVGWLQKELKVEFPDEAEIMRVSLESLDPVMAHKIVKAVVDTYMNDVVEKEKIERLARLETLEKILRETEDKIRKKRNDLSGLVASLGMSDKTTVDLSQQLTLQQFGQVRSQLAKTNFDIMALQNELEVRKSLGNATADANANTGTGEKANSDGNPTATPTNEAKTGDGAVAGLAPGSQNSSAPPSKDPRLEEMLETDREAVKLNKEVERLQGLIRNAPRRYDSKTSAVFLEKFQAQLSDAQSKLAERTKRLEQRLPDNSGIVSSGVSDVEMIGLKIGVFQKQQELLRQEMAGLMEESKKFGRSSIDVEMLRKEIDALEPMVVKVNQNVERTKIELQSASRITRFQSDGVPTVGENKKRFPMTAAAGLLGLLGPLALLVLRDIRRHHINNIATINNGLRISVLGSIPYVPSNVRKRLNDPNHAGAVIWRERVEESVTGVTAMLLRKFMVEGNRVIMICSATSGEGKSTLSELLARNLAESGHRTLLIDFDLRRPQLHRRFSIPLSPGVTDVLRNGAELRQTTRKTSSANLDILTAGNQRGNLLLEAANGTFETLFKECRSDYEMVIVDTSPLMPVVDGRLIGQFSDGAIMAVTKDSSQVHRVLATRNIMDDYGIPILGCVVIGTDNEDYYDSYGRSNEVQNSVEKGIGSSRSMSAM